MFRCESKRTIHKSRITRIPTSRDTKRRSPPSSCSEVAQPREERHAAVLDTTVETQKRVLQTATHHANPWRVRGHIDVGASTHTSWLGAQEPSGAGTGRAEHVLAEAALGHDTVRRTQGPFHIYSLRSYMLVCISRPDGIAVSVSALYLPTFVLSGSSIRWSSTPSVTRCWHRSSVSDIIVRRRERLILVDYSPPEFRRFSIPQHVSRGIALQRMVTSEDGVEAVWKLEVRIRKNYL